MIEWIARALLLGIEWYERTQTLLVYTRGEVLK